MRLSSPVYPSEPQLAPAGVAGWEGWSGSSGFGLTQLGVREWVSKDQRTLQTPGFTLETGLKIRATSAKAVRRHRPQTH